MVLADMQLAANTPSDIIIFNIDAKSESDGKQHSDQWSEKYTQQ